MQKPLGDKNWVLVYKLHVIIIQTLTLGHLWSVIYVC